MAAQPEPQTPKRAAVQAAVLTATEELLGEGATYADLGIERIATRAGISRTAFYFYFRDKRELLMRLTEDVAELLYVEADRWWSGAGDGAEELADALRNVAELYDAHGALLKAIVEVSTYDEEVAGFWRALVGRFTEATMKRLDADRGAGRSPLDNPEATAFALTWMTERSFYQSLVQGEPLGREPLIKALVDIWIAAVYGTG